MVDTHLKKNYIDWLPGKEGENLLIVADDLGNLQGRWEYLVVSDAFAKVPALIAGTDSYGQFFEKLKQHLTPGGHVILAVDNRYGLQYFAGSKERLTGKYFEGLEGYENSEGVRTFSKKVILEMVGKAGFSSVKTFYPYPNYRYMTALYTDAHLPAVGELTKNLCNFEEERVVLFEEAKVFDGLIREGKFQEFSNSYLFDLTLEEQKTEEEILFIKYSVEREEVYRIRTEIVKKADGNVVVRKIPYTEAAVAHVERIKHWEEVLTDQYEPAGVSVNRCTLTSKGAEFEFIKGRSLEKILDEYLAKDDYPGFLNEMKNYAEKLQQLLKPQSFQPGEKFKEIFGEISFDTPQTAATVNNIDLIFSNIILTDGRWNVIDYEWTFEFAIPVKFIIHRAIALYCSQKRQKALQSKELSLILGISKGEQQCFEEMEHRLQVYLLGNTKTMDALWQEHAGKVIDLKTLLYRAHQPEMKIYYDHGQGFSEARSEIIEVKEDFYGRRRFSIAVASDVTGVRLDPCEEPCIITVNRLLGECSGSYELTTTHNGKSYEKSILYTTSDPQLIIGGIVPGTGQLHVDVTVEYLKEETSYLWMKLLNKAEKCDRMEASVPYKWMKKVRNLLKKG